MSWSYVLVNNKYLYIGRPGVWESQVWFSGLLLRRSPRQVTCSNPGVAIFLEGPKRSKDEQSTTGRHMVRVGVGYRVRSDHPDQPWPHIGHTLANLVTTPSGWIEVFFFGSSRRSVQDIGFRIYLQDIHFRMPLQDIHFRRYLQDIVPTDISPRDMRQHVLSGHTANTYTSGQIRRT